MIIMFHVYVLECRDGSLYTGYTDDVKKRVKKHNAGKASKYTRSRLPVRLFASWQFETKSHAMKFEALVKKLPRKEKLAKIRQNMRI
jgi:putative endonuclease